MSKFLLIGLTLFFVSCAPTQERYLTYEEDQQLKEQCEPHGCVAIPVPLFEQIVKALKGMRSA